MFVWGRMKNYRLQTSEDLSEIPMAQRRKPAKALAYYEQKHRERDEAIMQAYQSGGYSLKAIGEHFVFACLESVGRGHYIGRLAYLVDTTFIDFNRL